ncbi:PAS-domain containing protein [Sneathiella marina]|uniref:PAS-domain containing protein n=1 Tax=Sneathiella marina TaxID=2950108 RepID=A0ABY4W5W0_9PROT|nr:adenylate/guanylate cyclase domain-containing protein [Sneathiella marina]USG61277.1 PAS-domain containing protein [Sneathiella marina]
MIEDNAHRKRTFLDLKINGKLFLALSLLASMSVIAGIIAWYSFVHVSLSTDQITKQSLPEMESALKLAEYAAEISSSAPDLMVNTNMGDHRKTIETLDQRIAKLRLAIENSPIKSGDIEKWGKLNELEKELSASLTHLKNDVELRLAEKSETERNTAELARIHQSFLLTMEPLIDDAVFNFVLDGEKISAKSGDNLRALIGDSMTSVNTILAYRTNIDTAEDLLSEAIFLRDPKRLETLRGEFDQLEKAVDSLGKKLQQSESGRAYVLLGQSVLDIGQSENDIFSLKQLSFRQQDINENVISPELIEQYTYLQAAYASFQQVFSQMMMSNLQSLDSAAQKEATTSSAEINHLIDIGANTLQLLLSLRAEGNLVAGILSEAANVSDMSLIGPFQERFEASSDRIVDMLEDISESSRNNDLAASTVRLLDIGTTDNNLFETRRSELEYSKRAVESLTKNRAISLELNKEVADLVSTAKDRSVVAELHSGKVVASGKAFLILVAMASVLTALLVMVFYIRPRIIRPLENITDTMTRLAGGDTAIAIPSRDRNDELGSMANALAVFRDTAVEIQESNHRELEVTRRRLVNAIENISEGFSLYDANDRLVVCNSVYCSQFFPDQSIDLQYGKTFETIMREAADQDFIEDAVGRHEEWIAESLVNHHKPSSSYVQRRVNGRWILINERKAEDGSTVAVYSDITKIKQQEEAIAEQSTALERLSNQLAKYLSPQVYASIFEGTNRGDITSRRKKLTVFFSDIVGFTEITERLEAEDLTRILNQYLTEMSEIALAHGATIDKFVGDAIVIFFGDPESRGVKEDAVACAKMALVMKKRLQELNEEWFEIGIEKPLQSRIGINTGYCTVGNFGSSERMDYTAIGNGVNIASRLESTAATGEIRISHETYANIKDEIQCGNKNQVSVKGIKFPIATYEILNERDEALQSVNTIHEEFQNLKLDINLKDMSSAGRRKTEALLQRVLSQIAEEDNGNEKSDTKD